MSKQKATTIADFTTDFILAGIFASILFGTFAMGLGLTPIGLSIPTKDVLGEQVVSQPVSVEITTNQTSQFRLQDQYNNNIDTRNAIVSLTKLLPGEYSYLIAEIVNINQVQNEVEVIIDDGTSLEGVDRMSLVYGGQEYMLFDSQQNIYITNYTLEIDSQSKSPLYLNLTTHNGIDASEIDIEFSLI